VVAVFQWGWGLGLAAAVLLDATVVRLVLVPAAMELLGDRNWWLPAGLGRLLPAGRPAATPQLV
jgi:RND superfamily putative drug exporter